MSRFCAERADSEPPRPFVSPEERLRRWLLGDNPVARVGVLVLLVGSDVDAYNQFYNVIANPILWFIQHYLWDLSNAPDIRQAEVDAW